MPTSMSNCSICDYSGLGIVFLSHTAVAIDEAFAPSDARALKTHADSATALGLPPLANARPVLRSLRPGTYLHVYHENPPAWLRKRAAELNKRRKPEDVDPDEAHWEVLRTVPGGALVPQDHPYFDTADPFSCTLDGGTHIYTAMTYRLRDAHQATGIRVAVSGNLWSRELRARNKDDPQAMDRIDVAAALAGNAAALAQSPRAGSPFIPAPDAAWFDGHVADFALHALDHGGRPGLAPLAPVKDGGASLAQRMQALSAGHPQTAGKAFAYVLRDPVGLAQSLADISRARYQQGQDHAHRKSHALKSAGTLEMIRSKIYDAELKALRQASGEGEGEGEGEGAPARFGPADLHDERGRPRFANGALAQRLAAAGQHVHHGELDQLEFDDRTAPGGPLPADAVLLHFADHQPNARTVTTSRGGVTTVRRGLVLLTREQLALLRTHGAARKMDRLHDRPALQQFMQQHQQQVQRHDTLVEGHDRDRCRALQWPALAAYMRRHYDPADPNPHLRPHKPGETYMNECCAVLNAGPPTPALAEVTRQWLTAVPSSEAGWVLRAMVANQQALVTELDTFWAAAANWYTSTEGKGDKSFDALKALLSDDYTGGYMRAKFGWLTHAGIETSLSVHAFLSGAAEQLKSSAFAKAAGEAAQAAQAGAVQRADAGLQLLELAEAQLSIKLNAWSHQFSLLLSGVLHRQPPPRPVRARAWIELEQFLELVEHLSQQGVKLNRKTRTLWQQVMTDADHARKVGREAMWVELLTDDVRLRNAQDVMALGREASGLRLTVLTDVAGLARTISVSTAWLAEHFELAHRYDKLKNATLRMVSEGIPMAGTAALLALTQPARGTLEGTRGVVGPGGTIERGIRGAGEVGRSVAGSAQAAGRALAASETVGLSGALSIFSAGLQWHLQGVNEVKLAELRDRLVRFPGLKDEQKQAINDAISMIELGMWANVSGKWGGLAEVAGLAAADMRKAKFAQGAFASKAMSGVAAGFFLGAGLMGAVGGFMDAAQNYRRYQDKLKEGKRGMAHAFLGVSAGQAVGATFVGAAAVEIGYHWIVERKLLEGVTIRGVKNSAGRYVGYRFGYGWARGGLSLTGWGLVLTVLAYSAEFMLVYMDRTPLEEWVEQSYFGNKPKYRNMRFDDPDQWNKEEAAFVRALHKAQTEALTWDKVQEEEGPFPPLEARESRS